VVLATVGDLVEDIIVAVDELAASASSERELRLNLGADTRAVVTRRRGGSAANLAAAAGALGAPVRFIGQVGDDPVGDRLITDLADRGVDVVTRRAGRTGTVVVILHDGGERSMLTDRGASVSLHQPESSWLDGVEHLHVPLYSLAEPPLSETTATLVAHADERGIGVSLDVSATSLLAALGPAIAVELIGELRPALVFANEDEAAVLATEARPSELATVALVEKRGPRPARVVPSTGDPFDVAAVELGPVGDTTGAGDAFAAGFIVARLAGDDLRACAERGHRSAADHLRSLAVAGGD